MKEAVIVSSVRTAVGKAGKGTLHATRPDDLAAAAIRGALDRVPALDAKKMKRVAAVIHGELFAIVIILLCAAIMARGGWI